MAKKRFILFNNQKSGSNKKREKIKNQIMALFEKNDIQIEIFNSEYARHIEETIKGYNFDLFDGILGLGGDGTFNEIINGLHKREKKLSIPVGLIPLGTGNDFLRSLGPINPFYWVQKIIEGKTQKVDVIEVISKEKTFFSQLLTGWGVFYDAAWASEKYRWLGPLKYIAGSIEAILKSKKKSALIKVGDKEYKGKFWGGLICNTKYIGGGLLMAREAVINDGIFEFFMVRDISRIKLIFLFIQLALKIPLSPKLITLFKLQKVEIKPDISETLNIDGEFLGKSGFEAKMLPKSYEIFS
ncbi:diacylglycerol kinase family protein [Bacteriovoracales bacterium]|nr:diacylglycerol kinase family protein [Bacteriovoracales bacterium]